MGGRSTKRPVGGATGLRYEEKSHGSPARVKKFTAEEYLALERKAIRLRYVEGWPTKEISERLGKTDGAIRVLLTRTLARLRELM